jgi:hypothetical protein
LATLRKMWWTKPARRHRFPDAVGGRVGETTVGQALRRDDGAYRIGGGPRRFLGDGTVGAIE